MSVSLTKGGNVNLSKEEPGLKRIKVGLGWDARTTTGEAFDLDASAIALDASGKASEEKFFVYFENLASPDQSIVHSGDNLTGAGDGDDEMITIDLEKVPTQFERIPILVTVYSKGHNFGMVRNAFARVLNADTGNEIARYDLSEEAGALTCIVFAEVYRNNGDWKFKAVGQGYDQGFDALLADLGIKVAANA